MYINLIAITNKLLTLPKHTALDFIKTIVVQIRLGSMSIIAVNFLADPLEQVEIMKFPIFLECVAEH